MGYPGCKHCKGEMCTRDRYKRRLVCNPCEKHRLKLHKSLKKQQQDLMSSVMYPDPSKMVRGCMPVSSRISPSDPILSSFAVSPSVSSPASLGSHPDVMEPSADASMLRAQLDQIQRMHEIQRMQLEALQRRQLIQLQQHRKLGVSAARKTHRDDFYSSVLEGDSVAMHGSCASSPGVGGVLPRSSSYSSLSGVFENDNIAMMGSPRIPLKPRLDSLDAIAYTNDNLLSVPSAAAPRKDTRDIEEAIRVLVADDLPDVPPKSQWELSPIGSTDSEETRDAENLSRVSGIIWDEEKSIMKERGVLVHLNVKGNPSSFGIVPINQYRDSLSYVREYIKRRIRFGDVGRPEPRATKGRGNSTNASSVGEPTDGTGIVTAAKFETSKIVNAQKSSIKTNSKKSSTSNSKKKKKRPGPKVTSCPWYVKRVTV